MAEDNLTTDEFNAFVDSATAPAADSGWSLNSLFGNLNTLSNTVGNVWSAVGNSKAAIENAKLAAANKQRLLTTGQRPDAGFNTDTLKKLLPWILGFGALIVGAIVILPLLKSSSK